MWPGKTHNGNFWLFSKRQKQCQHSAPEMTSPGYCHQQPAVFCPSLLLIRHTHVCTHATGGLRVTRSSQKPWRHMSGVSHHSPVTLILVRRGGSSPLWIRTGWSWTSFNQQKENADASSNQLFCSFIQNFESSHAPEPPDKDWNLILVFGKTQLSGEFFFSRGVWSESQITFFSFKKNEAFFNQLFLFKCGQKSLARSMLA